MIDDTKTFKFVFQYDMYSCLHIDYNRKTKGLSMGFPLPFVLSDIPDEVPGCLKYFIFQPSPNKKGLRKTKILINDNIMAELRNGELYLNEIKIE
jgi:hypothetical protein